MFPHHNIHKYTWTSDEKMHSEIDHVLIDDRCHSSVVDVHYFRGVVCDTDHYMVVAEIWHCQLVNKQHIFSYEES